jgi:hypothetical protein
MSREFAGMVAVDTVQMHPHFMVGDFDGNGKSDLVVIGRLVSATPERAEGGSHMHVYVPMGTGMKPVPRDIRMSADLLATWRGEGAQLVIHDFRRATSSPRRENALLLFSANGESVLRLERGPLKPAITGDEPEPIPPPALKGDAILLLRDDGAGEALYWDGERYRWYPYGDWR